MPTASHSLGGIAIAPDSFFPACISLSVIAQVFVLPILGAIADYSHRRKQMLQIFATLGAMLTILLFFVTAPIWWLGGLLFFGANLAFGAAVVFYNAYLPDIASEDQRDRVSSFGWAMGYLGDGILLALNLAFYHFPRAVGSADRILRFVSIWPRRRVVAELLVHHVGTAAAPARAAQPTCRVKATLALASGSWAKRSRRFDDFPRRSSSCWHSSCTTTASRP